MILVDTSVWIDFFRGKAAPEADWLASALSSEENLCTCGIVLTEVLQGVLDDREHTRVMNKMIPLIYLPLSMQGFELAARIYRKARKEGKTVRHSVDCMIAACAIEHRVPLLQRDRDFEVIAGVSSLRIQSIG